MIEYDNHYIMGGQPENENTFCIRIDEARSNTMRGGTGSKTRKIQASSANVTDLFDFNKSIVPHGGTSSKIKLKQRRNGTYVVKIFQDTNNNGRVTKKELIYKGESRQKIEGDILTNFDGEIRLKKNMHMCEWVTAKFQDELIACTMEYIPTTYNCVLKDYEGEQFNFEGIGDFATDDVYQIIDY